MKYKPSSGFTLIELIVVIVILGILAVTAAPRFIDVADDARDAITQSQFGSFRSAISLMRTKYLIKQTSPIDVGGGVTVTYTSDGWPIGNGTDSTGCNDLWSKAFADAEPISSVTSFTAVLPEGWYSFGYNNQLCGYIKANGNEALSSGNIPHFVYYMTDFPSQVYAGTTYQGSAGQVLLYNL